MVSFIDRPRKRAAVASVIALASVCTASCSRQVELADDPVYNLTPAGHAPLGDGGIPLIADAGLDDPALGLCSERPEGDCVGENDFPCDFERWLGQVIGECQQRTDCSANDWLVIEAESGCATAIGMLEPNADFVACLAQTLGAFHCPCSGSLSYQRYLGVANRGCNDASADLR